MELCDVDGCLAIDKKNKQGKKLRECRFQDLAQRNLPIQLVVLYLTLFFYECNLSLHTARA